MSELSEIKRRLVSAKQTLQITSAMRTVSTAKLQKATARLESCMPYTEAMRSLACAVFERTPPSGKRTATVVIASDRGLNGGYDNDIFKRAGSPEGIILPIGGEAVAHYKDVPGFDPRFASMSEPDVGADTISDFLMSGFSADFDEVYAVYAIPRSHTAREIVKKCLLPFDGEKSGGEYDGTVFEPSRGAIAEALLPLYLRAELNYALCAAKVAEHGARLVAMTSASDSAERIIQKLSLEYNRLRQASVTEQIVEMIGSAGALRERI